MEQKHYFNIYTYLFHNTLPEDFSPQQQQQLIKQSNNYILKDNLLFKKDKKDSRKLYRVITRDEMATVLYMMHNDPTSGHLGIKDDPAIISPNPQYCGFLNRIAHSNPQIRKSNHVIRVTYKIENYSRSSDWILMKFIPIESSH